MSTDRELLELAAKAAGIDVAWWENKVFGHGYFVRGHVTKPWNPLTDDGDALRLAVKLRISIQQETLMVSETPDSVNCGCYGVDLAEVPWAEEPLGDEEMAATRRAIVRAAAEIGKATPGQEGGS